MQQLKLTMCEIDFSVIDGIWNSCTGVFPAVLKNYTKNKKWSLTFLSSVFGVVEIQFPANFNSRFSHTCIFLSKFRLEFTGNSAGIYGYVAPPIL